MTDGTCQGSCNNGYRKAKALYEAACAAYDKALLARAVDPDLPEPRRPEPPETRPWPGDPIFCLRCQGVIHRELAELDDLAALRASQVPGGASGGDHSGRVSGSRTTSSPSPAVGDVDELAEWLRAWESIIRGDDPRPRVGYLASEVTTVTAWLTHHFGTIIINTGIAEDFGTETRQWHRELTGKTKAGSGMRHQKQPCPRCQLYTLWLTDGEDYIRCVNEDCARLMTRAEYANLTKAA
jgi:hypothetical protein